MADNIYQADVLVIGGGPAGTWAAFTAASKVILVDKGYCGSSGATASAGTSLWFAPDTQQQAQAIGITSITPTRGLSLSKGRVSAQIADWWSTGDLDRALPCQAVQSTGGPSMIEIINSERCIKCNLCVLVCPVNVFDKVKRGVPVIARQSDCQTCYMCELYCPVDAMYVPLPMPVNLCRSSRSWRRVC